LRILCDGCDTEINEDIVTPLRGAATQIGRQTEYGLCPNCVNLIHGFIENIRREKTTGRIDANGKE